MLPFFAFAFAVLWFEVGLKHGGTKSVSVARLFAYYGFGKMGTPMTELLLHK